MKKLLFFTIAIFVFSLVNAQQFGIKAGFNSTSAKITFDGASVSGSSSGFYAGFLANFELSDQVELQPELLFVNISENGQNESSLLLPIMFKYNVSDEFSILAGPQVRYILEESVEDITNFGVDFGAGVSYDIDENFFVDARYMFGLTNQYTGSLDMTAKYSFFQVGIGYKFN